MPLRIAIASRTVSSLHVPKRSSLLAAGQRKYHVQSPISVQLKHKALCPQWRLTVRSVKSPLFERSLSSSRAFFTDSLPSILVPPVLFTALLLGLWSYKCLMTVIFQDRIIYMPYMPPFTRSEKVADYTAICKPVEWETKHINSMDRTRIAICTGKLSRNESIADNKAQRVVICYFHGNGGSLPPRLPMLSNVLKAIDARSTLLGQNVEYTLIALSYRGYWTSSGRASQRGIELDAQALIQHITATYATKSESTRLVLWGQSIGAGVASNAAAKLLQENESRLSLVGLVLETPFTSIKAMLLALYPQKWLPYQYLHPFLWNHWDSEAALIKIAEAGIENAPKVLLLPATRDEVVPPGEVSKLEDLCRELRLDVDRRNIIGALHTEATTRREGQKALAEWIVNNHKSP